MADGSKTNELPVNMNRSGSDRIRLQKMRVKLINELDFTEIEKLLDILYSEQIFNTEEKNKVAVASVPEGKMRMLLDILAKKVDIARDPPVLDIVVGFLRDNCGKEDLARKLIETDGSPATFTETKNIDTETKNIDTTEFVAGASMIADGLAKSINALRTDLFKDQPPPDLFKDPMQFDLFRNPHQTNLFNNSIFVNLTEDPSKKPRTKE